ncbi:DNA alkylation repair protein [Leptospira ognonensis]|uniref:DNA alkylation repair protein n=1 Tax=Leptospira ognonensis TaxID=2484945 RepID=A0A4R9JXM5_9LEPT|nr:DNA alkylation repair protein [Leptospira ognonensis]TGL57951.1 DNA alkylation repair protein [Leptospira ognonensis]
MKPKDHPLVTNLKKVTNSKKAAFFPKFFKTGKGQYGYGDKFLGVTVPEQRKIAKSFYSSLSQDDFKLLLDNEYHEVRLTALLALVLKYQKTAKTEVEKKRIVDLYKSKLDRINNWDLVDSSADKILGSFYFDKNRGYLHKLSKSKNLWEVRIGILATFYFIRCDQFEDTLVMCRQVLNHEHDLIHKASGWMLREIGNRNKETLLAFLNQHAKDMPRTMLRYAIEKFPQTERQYWLTF